MGCLVVTGFILLVRLTLSLGASVWQKRLLVAGVPPAQLWNQTYLWMVVPAVLLVAYGLALGRGSVGSAQNGFWLAASVAGVLDALGNRAFGESLRRTDLSIFGPLNAFRPVLALGLGMVFLGERPPVTGAWGIGLITLGAVGLLYVRPTATPRPGVDWIGLFWRLAGLGLSTLGAVFLKKALGLGTVGLTLGVWTLTGGLILGLGKIGPEIFRRPKGLASEVSSDHYRGELAGHAAIFLVMQALTLILFRATWLAYAFAWFQLVMILQVILGHRLFREPHPGRRLLAAVVMGIGAVLLASTR